MNKNPPFKQIISIFLLFIIIYAQQCYSKPTTEDTTTTPNNTSSNIEESTTTTVEHEVEGTTVSTTTTTTTTVEPPHTIQKNPESENVPTTTILPEASTTEVDSNSENNEIASHSDAANDNAINKIESANDDDNKIIIDDDDYLERVEYAKKMLSYMNLTVDPCDDFYEYSCGNWKNVIQKRQTPRKRSNLIDIIYLLSDMVEDLIEHPPESSVQNYTNELNVVRKFYKSCLNANLYPTPRSEVYLEVIKSIGGFPAVDDTWNAANFSWFNMSAHLTNYGIADMIQDEILPQYPFPPYFKLPELGFEYFVHSDNIKTNTSRGYLLNEKRMRDYLTTYGVDEEKRSKVISDIFDFWRLILNVADEFNEDLNKCREIDAEKELPEWEKWEYYTEIAWHNKDFPDYDVECPCNYYYMKLDEICEEHKEAAANYMAMRFLFMMDARLEDKKFQKEYCSLRTKMVFAYFIDKLYVAKYLNDEIRNQVYTVIKEIRKSLRAKLSEADWLDESTRTAAFLKESTIVERVGKYDDPVITDRLIREINELNLSDDYEHNNVQMTRFKQNTTRYLGLHFEEISNDTKPLELLLGMQVNAFYYNIDNSITVMAGILNPPAYHKSWPQSLKYGTLGFLIGHEFTHGFDTIGANYDSEGEENYWWSKKSGKVFNERTDCYVNHYGNYEIPEIKRKINGNLTKDENIADSGGLREALMSYRNHMASLKRIPGESEASVLKDEVMPGLDLTPEQLFFIGFAQLWCASYKEEHYWEELTNEHTIDKYRVLGAVSNIEDFSKAYHCPLGSKMNPEADKCRVW